MQLKEFLNYAKVRRERGWRVGGAGGHASRGTWGGSDKGPHQFQPQSVCVTHGTDRATVLGVTSVEMAGSTGWGQGRPWTSESFRSPKVILMCNQN